MAHDDYFMGSYSEIGEALRGLQDSEIGASAQQLAGMRGQLAGRFAPHAPVSKVMRSPYKDSTQIGVKCTGTFDPAAWANQSLPVVSGQTRVYKSFKPTKAIVTELVTATFTQQGQPNVVLSASVPDGSDLVLVSAFSGADNCFPNAPSESNGIAGVAFANNSLGNGISWPTINGGIDMSVQFAIEPTALSRIAVPAGYVLASVFVSVRFNLLGPSLR